MKRHTAQPVHSAPLPEQLPVQLRLSSYDYELPEHLIAQTPSVERGGSRLLHVQRELGTFQDRLFAELPELLKPDDVLVLNNTRVIPARLRGFRESGGKVELILLRCLERLPTEQGKHRERWAVLGKPASRFRVGTAFHFGRLEVWPEVRTGEGWQVRLEAELPILEALEQEGELPLPPYIQRGEAERHQPEDRQRYQTVYAADPGSAAAPTAGLHFTNEILERLKNRGIEIHYLTLHVGPGTFNPVRTEDITAHTMHQEVWQVGGATWRRIVEARQQGRRIVAVGTTSVRTLETLARQFPHPLPSQENFCGETGIFIYPGFEFQVVDAIITNFHLPRSSLIMLVSAFASRERVLSAYQHAIEQGYRFFSYGDAMLLE